MGEGRRCRGKKVGLRDGRDGMIGVRGRGEVLEERGKVKGKRM